MHTNELERYLQAYLQTEQFSDYCPNGLQVQGRTEVHTLVTGVTASLALIEAALAQGADALLVHHGYFWRGEDPRIVGPRQARIARLVRSDLNLFAYHLPLDAHPEVGNNAQLALKLGVTLEVREAEHGLLAGGRLAVPQCLAHFGKRVETALGRAPLVIGDPGRPVARVALCTGAGQGLFERAIAWGADVFLTGEVSEPQYHLACESGVGFVAAGHHATERYGVQALGEHLARQFQLVHQFIEIPNPV
jgi:dinuclear metal center YbgI/SA1388 family protein